MLCAHGAFWFIFAHSHSPTRARSPQEVYAQLMGMEKVPSGAGNKGAAAAKVRERGVHVRARAGVRTCVECMCVCAVCCVILAQLQCTHPHAHPTHSFHSKQMALDAAKPVQERNTIRQLLLDNFVS